MQIFFVCYTLSMTGPVKRSGFIYFLLSEKFDAVKIGFTRSNIEKRLKYAATWYPYDYDMIKLIEGTMLEERNIHKRFVKDKIRGEWFHYSAELKEYIENL